MLELDFSSTEDNNDYIELISPHIQGNILRPHGRQYVRCLFVRFNKKKLEDTINFINDLGEIDYITSAHQQFKAARAYKLALKNNEPLADNLFAGLYLSASAYRFFGLSLSQFEDNAFLEGMKKSGRRLSDPKPERWQNTYQDDIHCLLLLACQNKKKLEYELNQKRNLLEFDLKAEILGIEKGVVISNDAGHTIEHFGYVDGASNPTFYPPNRDTPVPLHWNSLAPLDIVLVEDILPQESLAFGSYLVFRKLEQNVKCFKDKEKKLAEELKLAKKDEELSGAYLVGRFENGMPVMLSNREHQIKGLTYPEKHKPANDFNYHCDPKGNRCPLHAHIRKVNPRPFITDENGNTKPYFGRNVVRRGITYDDRKKEVKEQHINKDKYPDKNVGLLFMCFQASIEKQFEFMQAELANKSGNPDFEEDAPELEDEKLRSYFSNMYGDDPIAGQGRKSKQKYPEKYDSNKKTKPFEGFGKCDYSSGKQEGVVTLKGGEYFFAPSIPFIKNFRKIIEDEL